MAMDEKSVDMTVAVLMIPIVEKLLDRVKSKEYGEEQFQEIVDYYFRFRRAFEATHNRIRRGTLSY